MAQKITCKDCKFSKRADSWNIRCYHEKWKTITFYNGRSAMKGINTTACECFEPKK